MVEAKVNTLRELVQEIEIAMMTTRRADGHLVSRPMAVQKEAPGADFWFVTERGTDKVRELRGDPHLNLGFYKDRTREYVSVSGTAVLTDDREIIGRLYAPDWKMWFEDKGGAMDGSADDPRLLLIGVRAVSAQFLSVDKPQIVVLYEVLKGLITKTQPDLGETRQVSGAEIREQGKS